MQTDSPNHEVSRTEHVRRRSGLSGLLKTVLPLAVALFVSAALMGCGGEPVPKAPMPPGATFTGSWYSNYEHMTLKQSGDKVSGTFEYKDGGKLSGTVQGGVLVFDWVQYGNLAEGKREIRGKGYFVMKGDGTEFEGKWGYNDSRTNGGTWTAEKLSDDVDKE